MTWKRIRQLIDGQRHLAREVRAEFTGLPPDYRLPSTAPIVENPAARVETSWHWAGDGFPKDGPSEPKEIAP